MRILTLCNASLREARQEHPCALGVFREAVAEFLGEEAFFAAGLRVKGKPGDGYGEQTADFAHGDRRAQQRKQNSRVGRMSFLSAGSTIT